MLNNWAAGDAATAKAPGIGTGEGVANGVVECALCLCAICCVENGGQGSVKFDLSLGVFVF